MPEETSTEEVAEPSTLDKFKGEDGQLDVEKLTQSYIELEKMKGGGGVSAEPAEVEPIPESLEIKPTEEIIPVETDNTDVYQRLVQEQLDTGELSDDSVAALVGLGLPRSAIEDSVAARKSARDRVNGEIAAAAGPAGYQAVTEWAAQHGDQKLVEHFNTLAADPETNAASLQLALSGFAQQHAVATASPTHGGSGGSGVLPFANQAEVNQAINDPRYQRDAGYMAEFQKRLAACKW